MKRKQLIPAVLAGTLIGAALVGPASAGVVALTAAPSTQTFYIDGKQVDLEAYVIHGHNYVQLRDVGRAVDFGVAYDQGANRVLVDTSSPYTEESAVSAPSGVVTVPQSDEPLRLKEGDKVLCDDGTTYEAEFVGNDASSDLAVIKLKDADASKLTPIEIGDSSKLNVGEWVMAIGSPFGNEQSVSTGIVSALYRSTAMSSTSGNTIYANMIQTDAAINPGNSGGALVNDNGELVGINSLIESYSGSSSGVGFAIPVNYAKNIADQIIDGKTPVHPYMGATLSSVNALNARTNKLSTDSGAYVASVVEDGPAAKAGIQEGDVITKLGDDEITSADGLIIALRSHEVGEKVEITLMRGKDEKKVTVELGSDEELQNQQQDDSSTDTGNGGITDEQLRQYLEELLGQQGQGY